MGGKGSRRRFCKGLWDKVFVIGGGAWGLTTSKRVGQLREKVSTWVDLEFLGNGVEL